MKKAIFCLLIVFTGSYSAFTSAVPGSEPVPEIQGAEAYKAVDDNADLEFIRKQQKRPQRQITVDVPQEHQGIQITEADLLMQPQLLHQLMMALVQRQNVTALRLLLPIYKKSANYDHELAEYVEARIAQDDGNMKFAIKTYRTLLTRDPSLFLVRFNLASALYLDKQYAQVRSELAEIRKEQQLPQDFLAFAHELELATEQQNTWSWDFNLGYVQDKNVNNAPDQQEIKTTNGTWTLPKPESAHGISYFATVNKDWFLLNNWGWRAQGYGFGKYYWDNKKYNDMQYRFSTGPVWQSVDTELTFMPFYGMRYYGERAYAETIGLRSVLNYHVNGKWRISTALEGGKRTHPKREYLNGRYALGSFSLGYAISPHQYLHLSVDTGYRGAQDPSDAYHHRGVRMGYTLLLPKNIVVKTDVSYSLRQYLGHNLFNVVQRNKVFGASFSLWKTDWQWKGFMPKFNIDYERTCSNYVIATYHKTNIYLDISKSF